MAIPVGVFNLFYQPQNVEYYITLNPTSQFQPTISVFLPGATSQQWNVSGDQSSSLRSVCSVSSGMCIGRSAVDINNTLTEPTPILWYLSPSTFGLGWFSANSNDAGPWWVVGINPSSGLPESIILDSDGWDIFFLRPVATIQGTSSKSTGSSTTFLSTSNAGHIISQSSTTIYDTNTATSTTAAPFFASTSITNVPATPTATAPSTGEQSNGLSNGDIASLASSIPLGVLGLVIGVLGIYYTRKQMQAGKPVWKSLKTDFISLYQRPRRDHVERASHVTGNEIHQDLI
ncbi:hypothetical protein JR316_0012711 [Psilocybe cubensis]|uniref:Uncharacterized protein n=2 Tax=Psilocybe cubensis TaxID=181762 RepID=A0ACB8GKK7_PSICU|nr:hypothetical protein JR316_0012711 [Psilocybe cubensis]KAH9475594.1 hypothetical protein JR316_0012711 [Psilocybe cubensis]